jgi:hypothetical protein
MKYVVIVTHPSGADFAVVDEDDRVEALRAAEYYFERDLSDLKGYDHVKIEELYDGEDALLKVFKEAAKNPYKLAHVG